MAMTKKEREELERVQEEVRLARALRWSAEEPVRDVPPPQSSSECSRGWDFNAMSRRVYRAWSSASRHGEEWPEPGTYPPNGAQGSVALYSTSLRATQALRCQVERQSAWQLLHIDAHIAKLTSSDREE